MPLQLWFWLLQLLWPALYSRMTWQMPSMAMASPQVCFEFSLSNAALKAPPVLGVSAGSFSLAERVACCLPMQIKIVEGILHTVEDSASHDVPWAD